MWLEPNLVNFNENRILEIEGDDAGAEVDPQDQTDDNQDGPDDPITDSLPG